MCTQETLFRVVEWVRRLLSLSSSYHSFSLRFFDAICKTASSKHAISIFFSSQRNVIPFLTRWDFLNIPISTSVPSSSSTMHCLYGLYTQYIMYVHKYLLLPIHELNPFSAPYSNTVMNVCTYVRTYRYSVL